MELGLLPRGQGVRGRRQGEQRLAFHGVKAGQRPLLRRPVEALPRRLDAPRLQWTADGVTTELRGPGPEIGTSLGRSCKIAAPAGAKLDALRPVGGKIKLQVVGRGEISITLRFMLLDVDGAQHLFEKEDPARK